ncbi:MAG: hypothetical protein SFU25_03180 [Candidatus Caenarcaniphilales bacterium]|nr:hypothetical protein [Candidatus Caenarcaniphilales bacterium]
MRRLNRLTKLTILLVPILSFWVLIQNSETKFNQCLVNKADNLLESRWEEPLLAEVMQNYLTNTQRDRVIRTGIRYNYLSRFEILDYIRESIKQELITTSKLNNSCRKEESCLQFNSWVLCSPIALNGALFN